MTAFRDKLVEAQNVLSEHMHDFVQMQFNIEMNISVQHELTAGPVFIWEPSVDLILQTQDTVITGVEHLNDHAKRFLVGFFFHCHWFCFSHFFPGGHAPARTKMRKTKPMPMPMSMPGVI